MPHWKKEEARGNEVRALAVLRRDGECTTDEIAQELSVSFSAALRILARLQQGGKCKSRLAWIGTTRKMIRKYALPNVETPTDGPLPDKPFFRVPVASVAPAATASSAARGLETFFGEIRRGNASAED